MPLEHFEALVAVLRGALTVNQEMAKRRSPAGAIIPELRLHCVIRWLAGGSYLDICSKVNMHPSTFYHILWNTCDAICRCEQLALHFPTALPDLRVAARGFASISTDNVVNGMVGAVDGWLLPTIVPPARFGNVMAYFSGHYSRYGLNIQAVCDHLCRFTFIAVAAPGSQPDVTAFRRSGLERLVDQIDAGFYLIGDNAYPVLERLLPVYGGTDRLNDDNDNANFYMSQCRIRIEMAFGLMTKKWCLLRSPLQIDLERVGTVVETVARLHNFCIDRRVFQAVDEDSKDHPQAFDEVIPRNTSGDLVVPAEVAGQSMTRRFLVQRVKRKGLSRP